MNVPRPLPVLAALAGASMLAAAPAAPAAAAPPWTPPHVVATTAMRDPQLAFGTGASGVASLGFGESGTRSLSLASGAAAPTAARDVNSVADGPLPYARTRTVSLRQRSARGLARTLGYSFGRTDGAVGAFHPLRTVQLDRRGAQPPRRVTEVTWPLPSRR